MHIAIVFPHISYPGGATNYLLETSKCLTQMGFTVSIISQYHDKNITGDYTNIHYYDLGGQLPNTVAFWFNFVRTYIKFESIIDKIKPDVIISHVFPSNFLSSLYKILNKNTNCIWICHEPSAFIHNKVAIDGLSFPLNAFAKVLSPCLKPVDKLMMNQNDFVVVNSKFTQQQVRQIYGIETKKIAYPGVNINEFPDAIDVKDGYILTVGRLTKFKNISILINSMYILKQMGYSNKLIIVGDGEERKKLEILTSNLKLENQIYFTGVITREHLIDLYIHAICVVYPSVYEPFGIVPIEAQAAFTPVIASSTGGPRESVIQGKTGILIDQLSDYTISEALISLINNPELVNSMGINGHENVKLNYSWRACSQSIAQAINALYNGDLR